MVSTMPLGQIMEGHTAKMCQNDILVNTPVQHHLEGPVSTGLGNLN